MNWVPPRSRLVLWGVASATVLVVGLLLLQWTHAVVLALLPLLYAFVTHAITVPQDDPMLAAERLTQGAGRRDELSSLAWGMRSRSGLVPPRTMRRVGDLAAHLLAHHGVASEGGFPLVVAPDDVSRARALLGAGAATLLDAAPSTETRPRDLGRCLTALEALDPTGKRMATPLQSSIPHRSAVPPRKPAPPHIPAPPTTPQGASR